MPGLPTMTGYVACCPLASSDAARCIQDETLTGMLFGPFFDDDRIQFLLSNGNIARIGLYKM
ncbi:MAG: hypothetical protein KDB01_03975 [Planctomycetaceae bacterium]|nr:hypothetical protein [Planctomycetaceae bacterium]